MTSRIVTDFQLSIKEGKLEEFKAFVNTMIEVTDMKDPNLRSAIVAARFSGKDSTDFAVTLKKATL
jgi:hypothetical protein